MTSPLVTRLLAELNATANPEDRALLLAELGCYWARVGEFDQSENIRQELRREFGDGRSIRVSILIMIVEALQLYYRDLSPAARDRMSRASLLSRACQNQPLLALTSAWMAHIEFNQARFDSMINELAICLGALEPDSGFAECRVSLVFGDALLLAGQPAESQAWYEKARRAAIRIGDQAAVGAMTYNRAALRVARTRYEGLRPGAAPVDIPLLRLDVESAINYQYIAQLRSLDHLLATARVGLLILQERWVEVIPLIESLLSSVDVISGTAQHTLLSADYAHALAKGGRRDDAVRQLLEVLALMPTSLPSDDRCLTLASLRQAAVQTGQTNLLADLQAQLDAAIDRHEEVMLALRTKLSRFDRPEF